jgi:glyoxylase-like metal-dependent hydrolase (beta-lactamase superfamily II)
MAIEVRDVAPGLWLWRQPHHAWGEGMDWENGVSSFAVQSRGERWLIDPLAPPPRERAVWERIDAAPPTAVVVLKPDHVRDVDLFVRWYGCRAFGPWLHWPGEGPRRELEPVRWGDELPGGLLALDDGRGMMEKPLYLPEQRAIVVADALSGMGSDGVLRVWITPFMHERTLPAMRSWLELPFETVLVSHGHPVHDRAAFERALEVEPWGRLA